MKVLMLGWEFPPHISGGLGTACFGLTRGLAAQGVQLRFVLPRAHGDEDQSSVEVLGCNQVELPSQAIPAGGPPLAPSAAAPTPTATEEAPPSRSPMATPAGKRSPSTEFVVVDSSLRPYLEEEGYLRSSPTAEGGGTVPVPAAPRGRSGWKRFLQGLVAGHGPRSSPAPRRYDFGGSYGPGLYEEVARYAEVVAHLAESRDFELVHAHDWMTFPAGIAAARVAGVPLVIHVHALEYDRSGEHGNPRVLALEQLGLDEADRIVCVSHYTAGILKRRYRVRAERIRVVHNALTQAEQARAWHGEKRIPEPIVLFLGRVTFQKGPDYFLDAAARVARVFPRVKFVMSGSGDMLPSMIERSARLGIARKVHFTGFLRGAEVERMYAMADLYVMPSVSEPFGISPLEAMAADVPAIVSRQSGVSEVLRNALKVDFWDVQDLADKILALLSRPALRRELVESGREEVRRMRWEVRAEHLKQIYQELLP